ncbi:MmyB family transcriptional regulator [Streptomyces asiaticus]
MTWSGCWTAELGAGGGPPSLVRYVFTDPRARIAYPDWDRVADDQVAALK